MTARPVRWSQRANGPLMARKINNYTVKIKQQARILSLTWADTLRAGDGNRTRMTSLEGRWRGSARRQRSGPILLAAGVRGGGVTVTDRRLPSCVARMWHGWLA
jgi:hypothetical protein